MYKLEKEKFCAEFIETIEKIFPETKGKIEVTDVASPMTYYRYTDVWKGSWMGWGGKSKKVIPTSIYQNLRIFILLDNGLKFVEEFQQQ